MSTDRIHVDRATDADRYLASDQTVWFAEISSAPTEVQLTGLAPEHRFAVDLEGADPASYPGIYGVYPLTLTVPGPDAGIRQVPCAGLTCVGVHPDHPRRGVLTAMLRHHFEQVHADGGHLSALHASEPAIYGRHGYGLASLELEVKLGRGTTLAAPHLEEAAAAVTVRMVTVSDPDVPARLRACHLAHADLGAVVGAAGYYERVCLQLPEERRDKEPWRVLFAQCDGVDVGFALFRRTQKWELSRPAGEVEVWAVVGEPGARLALLRRLVDLDLIATVKVGTVSLDDPLLTWIGGPRSASEVRIHADPSGVAVVERTTADADLRLRTEALGAAYLGGGNLVALLRAGLVAEHRPGTVRELWRAMRTDLPPTAAVGF